MVVVRILAVSYNIIGSTTAILTQIKVCLAAIMKRWRQVRDTDTLQTPPNPLYVSQMIDEGLLNSGIASLWHHTPIRLSRQAPLAALSLGALRLGLGWYGQHNGVRNIADHLKFLHTCPKWMDNAFLYGGGCPYFGRLIQCYWLNNSNFGLN